MVMMPCITAFAASSTYTVQPGDSMWIISQKQGVTLDEILAANPDITDPGNIYAGQVINIPNKGTEVTPPVSPSSGKESLTYLYAGTTVSYLKILDNANDAIKTVCVDYFDVNTNGSLLITPSDKIKWDFINEMHNRGILVTPFISNHWDREKGNAALNNREALATQIAAKIEEYDLDGINIDIENVNEQYRDAYTDFTRLLRQKLPSNKVVAVAVAANPKGWNTGWHGSYDYKALANHSDYLMIMNYDESYQGGPAGPVSGSKFFEDSIKYAINQGVPKEKVVVGLPFFGRYWKTGDATGGIGITANDIEYLIGNYSSTVRYDEATQSANAVVTIKSGDPKPMIWGGRVLTEGTYNIWYDNLTSVKFKLNMINSYGLRGAGSWALGQEDTATWDFYTSILNGVQPEIPAPPPTPEPQPEPEPTPPPAPEPTPELPKNNLEKIIYVLNNKGNTRKVTASSTLTRGEVAVVLSEITYLKPEPQSESFADTASYWGAGQINALRRRGIIQSVQDNMFYPNRNITKEELTVMFEHILVLPNTIDYHSMTFKDVLPGRWSYNQIAKLYYFNIVEGMNKNFFKPEDTVSVSSMAAMLDKIDKYEYIMNPDKFMSSINARSKNVAPPIPEHEEPIIVPR